jgi:predicted nucleic acid-binding Zn ribbon protein
LLLGGWRLWELIMAIYEWLCDDCEIFWDREYPLAKNPERTRCPECKKLCDRLWGAPPPVHFKGSGWTSGPQGFNKTGGSDEVNLKLQEGCKDRMKTGWQHYSHYSPPKTLTDQARKLTDKEVSEKKEKTKKWLGAAYNNAKISPHIKHKPQ